MMVRHQNRSDAKLFWSRDFTWSRLPLCIYVTKPPRDHRTLATIVYPINSSSCDRTRSRCPSHTVQVLVLLPTCGFPHCICPP